VAGFFATSVISTALIAGLSSNPILLIASLHIGQETSNLRYINRKNSLGFDTSSNSLYLAHVSSIFPPLNIDDT
jgi:hypothetical protein